MWDRHHRARSRGENHRHQRDHYDTGLITNDFVTSDTTLAVSARWARRFLPVSSRKSALMAAHLAESFGKRFDLDLA